MPPKRTVPLAEHFWSKVIKGPTCWLWQASRRPAGYGTYYIERVPMLAHRVAWELTNGLIPDGLFVLHRCDTPPCVRPDHLFLGTAADNTRDARRKGRLERRSGVLVRCEWCGIQRYYTAKASRGGLRRFCSRACTQKGHAKLTAAQVVEIRERRARGERAAALAKEFGVSDSLIWQIERREKQRQRAA